jgi:diguanylate cyclase (GGDEF)-like protein
MIPGATSDQARRVAERIRVEVEQSSTMASTPITLSFGVAHFPDHGRDMDSLLKSADVALYAAKAAGRNRTCIYEPATSAVTAWSHAATTRQPYVGVPEELV